MSSGEVYGDPSPKYRPKLYTKGDGVNFEPEVEATSHLKTFHTTPGTTITGFYATSKARPDCDFLNIGVISEFIGPKATRELGELDVS
ncbi:hypothetical protein N7528_001255 [Penicillium herquei]|nr:hypothetical protein N7528_001255 [Penicillium herquei]